MAQKTSKSNESYFARYKQNNLYKTHRQAKLLRQLKLHPNNEKQIDLALKQLSNYRRKPSKVKMWSKSDKAVAIIMKKFTGKFSRDLFSQKPEDQWAASRIRNENLFKNTDVKPDRFARKLSEFSLGARAHDRLGNMIWAK